MVSARRFTWQSLFIGYDAVFTMWTMLLIYIAYRLFLLMTIRFFPQVKKKVVFALYWNNLLVSTIAGVSLGKGLYHHFVQGDSLWLHYDLVISGPLLLFLLYSSEMFARQDMPFPLLIHHCMTILIGIWSVSMRSEPQLKQMAVFVMFACLEQPSFIAMICYRCGSRTLKIWTMRIAIYSFALTRVLNAAWSVQLMVVDWAYYNTSFKIVFIIFMTIIVWAQFQSLVIYNSLLKKILKEKEDDAVTISEVEQNSKSKETLAENGTEAIEKVTEETEKRYEREQRTEKGLGDKLNLAAMVVLLGGGLLASIFIATLMPDDLSHQPYHLDGTRNSPTYSKLGSTNQSYAKPTGNRASVLPDPKRVSDLIFNRQLYSSKVDINQRSMFHISFGQFIAYDASFTATSTQEQRIFTGSSENESAWPMINKNMATVWFDLSQVYGTTEESLTKIRNMTNGCTLLLDGERMIPRDSSGRPILLDPRMLHSPVLLGIHTLFVREHNLNCALIKRTWPDLDSNTLFFRAREATILVYQKLIKYDYLIGYGKKANSLLLTTYGDYRADLFTLETEPEFNINYRLHSMIPDMIKVSSPNGTTIGGYTMDQVYFNTAFFDSFGLDQVLRGAMNTLAAPFQAGYPDSMRNVRFDLAQIDLIRSREFQSNTFNNARKHVGLKEFTEWSEFSSSKVIQENLLELYQTVDNVELLVGSLLEPSTDASFGDLVYSVIIRFISKVTMADRWGIANLEISQRPEDWKAFLKVVAYGRNMHEFVRQHTNMTCLPSDPMRGTIGETLCL